MPKWALGWARSWWHPFANGLSVSPVLALISADADSIDLTSSAAGTAYWLADQTAVRSRELIEAGGGSASGSFAVVAGANSQVVDLSAVPDNSYLHLVVKTAGGAYSNVVEDALEFAGQNVVDTQGVYSANYAAAAIANDGRFLFSAWIEPQVIDLQQRFFNAGVNNIYMDSAERLGVTFRDSSNLTFYSSTSASPVWAVGVRHHLYIYVDLRDNLSPILQIKLDGVDLPMVSDPAAITPASVNMRMGDSGSIFGGGTSFPADAKVSDVYISTGETIAVETFYNGGTPPDLSAVGTPKVLLNGDAAEWNADPVTHGGSIALTSANGDVVDTSWT